jgi:hypothetical protein
MIPLSSYALDRESIRLDAYRLLCLFFANKEIARRGDPNHTFAGPAELLERAFFPREMSRLLLSIAIALRTLDDQFSGRHAESTERDDYMKRREAVDKRYRCMMFDEMPLREVCNKIIHASVVEPHSTEGVDAHEYDKFGWDSYSDESAPEGDGWVSTPDPIPWEHLSGNIRLGGRKNGKQWWHLLEVPTFVEAVHELLAGDA